MNLGPAIRGGGDAALVGGVLNFGRTPRRNDAGEDEHSHDRRQADRADDYYGSPVERESFQGGLLRRIS